MALPSIPTSFVPRPTASAPAPRSAGVGPAGLGLLAYGTFGIVFMIALGVFFYDRMLASNLATDDAALKKAESTIDPATVDGFVRLRDRLDSSRTLLKNHIAFSGFFASLEKILPTNVRLSSLHLSIDSSGVTKVEGAGVAKSFNALAAASTAFATDDRIKDVIFSNITINKDGSVSFAISAVLDQKIIAYMP